MLFGAKRGAPPSYVWTCPICPHDVHLDLAVASGLEHEVLDTQEVRQGLLLGERQPGTTHIRGLYPLPSLDPERVAAAVAAARHTVLGYYRVREGCAFILEPAEVALAKERFPDPGSVVLLVERRESGPAEATFAFWRGEAFVTNLPHPFPVDAAALAAQPAAPPEREPKEPFRAVLRRNAGPIGVIAASALAVLVLPLMWLRSGPVPERPPAPPPQASPAIPVAAPVRGDVEIAWDRGTLPPVSAGLLKIVDGGVSHHVSLDLMQLESGSVVYTPGAGPITAELKVLLSDGEMVEVPVATRAARPAAPALPVAAVMPRVPPPPAAAASNPQPRQFPFPSSPPVEERRQATRRFEPPSNGSRAASGAPSLPDAPALQPEPAAAPVLNASLPAPPAPAASRIRLGPPANRVTPSLEHTAQGSGRLIWTGTLQRRGVVEFEGRSVSVGSLSGALPGVPVHVTVSPAEFGSNGLVVYTTDARLNGRVEPPSAANGWNRITYAWDPERARQIAVLESPNPSNRFTHLALRSDARHVSMLVIDWKAR